MPLYEYACLDCRSTFDMLRPMQWADTPVRCPACEGERTRRALSLVAARKSVEGTRTENPVSGGCACGGTCGCGGR